MPTTTKAASTEFPLSGRSADKIDYTIMHQRRSSAKDNVQNNLDVRRVSFTPKL